jgi:hypothetical protein
MSDPSDHENSHLRERFIRWQGYLRQSLSSHVTLIVSWSAGGLAFCGALLNSDHARFGGITTLAFLATGILFIVCLLMSLFISWNRLQDTRKTLKIVNDEMDMKDQDFIEKLREATKELGERTWCAVRVQLVLFVLAALCLIATALLAFKDRLHFCLPQ